LSSIPAGIFDGTELFGLELYNVSLASLNLANIIEKETQLQYLILNHVTLGALEAMPADHEITLAHVSWGASQKGIVLNNSQISVIERNAINFVATDPTTVGIVNSKIGVVEEGGIKLFNKIDITIKNSSVHIVNKESIKLDENANFELEDNSFILPEGFLNDRTCYKHSMKNNKFILYLQNDMHEVSNVIAENITDLPISTSTNDGKESETNKELAKFIHETCVDGNTILNLEVKETITKYQNPSTYLPTTQDDILTTLQNLQRSASYDKQTQFVIHKFVVYFVIVLLTFFILSTCILAGLLSCRKRGASHDIQEKSPTEELVRDRRPSLMYMPGSLYDSSITNETMSYNNTLDMKNYDI